MVLRSSAYQAIHDGTNDAKGHKAVDMVPIVDQYTDELNNG